MSEELRTADGRIIKWDRADRLRKSLRVAGVTPGEMADYLDVGGNTVSTWINGRIEPSYSVLRLWALRTRGAPDMAPSRGHGGMRARNGGHFRRSGAPWPSCEQNALFTD